MPRGISTGSTVDPSTKAVIGAMSAANIPVETIARSVSKAPGTVYAVIRQEAPLPALVGDIKKGLAGKLYQKGDKCLDAITDDKLQESSAYQLTGMASMHIEKALLIEGQPTQIVKHMESDIKLNNEIERLQAELSQIEGNIIDVTPDRVSWMTE